MYRVRSYTLSAVLVYTVTHTDAHGEEHDLSPAAPCQDRADLRSLVTELHAQGAYDAATMADLLGAVEAL